MDLRSIINTNDHGDSARRAAPVTPVTPVQVVPPHQDFRAYRHPPPVSPGKPPSQDHGAAPNPGAHDLSSPASHPHLYSRRPAPPPPIQAPPQTETRSPAGSYSAQSPYRPTPTSSLSGGYPFPQGHQTTPQSPAPNHPFPPAYQRDSYSQSTAPGPPPPPPHLQHHHSQGSPAPQTPPIGIPGQPHPFLQHQRSHSSLSGSTSTPTSAQSQSTYNNPYAHENLLSTPQFPHSQLPQNQRQQSQPGTPLGPPTSQRQSSGGFVQPTSPYQQRSASSGPFSNYQQSSPAPPPSASIPRLPSTPSAYDSQRTSLSEHQRRSQSERERSLSVSPKTRLPSHPLVQNMPQQQQRPQGPSPYNESVKRKMDDREESIEEPRRFQQDDVKPRVNGERHVSQPVSSSPQQPLMKRIRYKEPPIWAWSIRAPGARGKLNRPGSRPNGRQNVASPRISRPPATNGHQTSPAPANQRPRSAVPHDDPSIILGEWEKTISNVKPLDAISKRVADWIYSNVVLRQDYGELSSRGVQIEVEAKLGQVINQDTRERINFPVLTETIVADQARTAFKSSMTEIQHKYMNDFLNEKVKETHPNNSRGRVPLIYIHRRETDSFYELPDSHLSTLPPATQAALGPGRRHAVKVRVTTEQKSGQLLGMIIKTRVADLNIYNPGYEMDCRISINLEMPYPGTLEELKIVATDVRTADRNKDRLSYTQGPYQVDLTQVTQHSTLNGKVITEKEHELELELLTDAVREQGLRAQRGEKHEYLALIEGMVDNVRLLARTVPLPSIK